MYALNRYKPLIAILLVAFLALSFCAGFAPTAYASDTTRTGTAENVQATAQHDDGDMSDTFAALTEEIAPNVTTDELVGRIEQKSNDVVTILQTVGKYVCFASFIICCMLILIGIIGNRRLVAGGAIGLILSGIAYAGIVCGREIVTWIAAWAAS